MVQALAESFLCVSSSVRFVMCKSSLYSPASKGFLSLTEEIRVVDTYTHRRYGLSATWFVLGI